MMRALALTIEPEAYATNAEIVDRMATVIARHLQQKHECSINDLLAENFSMNDVSRFWAEANKQAEKKRPRPNWR
jgi:phosphoribosylaminoimidazole-succinocarboxamide synthase